MDAVGAQRASVLQVGNELYVALRWRTGNNGDSQPVVGTFHSVRQPTVVTVLGGTPAEDGGEPSLWPLYYSNPDLDEEHGRQREIPVHERLTPAPRFPEQLAEALYGELRCEPGEGPAVNDTMSGEAESDSFISRAVERASRDYPLAAAREAGLRPRVALFEQEFERFCRAEVPLAGGQEVRLSTYQYSRDLAEHVKSRGTVDRDFRSPSWSRWLHVGFRDGESPAANLVACRRFVNALRRLGVSERQVLVFTLGSGNLEVMFPSAAAGCLPRPGFEFVAGYICQLIADWSPICPPHDEGSPKRQNWHPCRTQPIDLQLYVPGSTVALPNTLVRGPGTFKVRVSLRELAELDAPAIAAIAAKPRPFNPPPWQSVTWATLMEISAYAVAYAVCRSQAADQLTFANRWVYPRTFDFISFGADAAEAESRLFSAAMNLLDFACPATLLEALLAPAASLSGLPAARVKATLENAVHTSRKARPLAIEPVPIPDDDEV